MVNVRRSPKDTRRYSFVIMGLTTVLLFFAQAKAAAPWDATSISVNVGDQASLPKNCEDKVFTVVKYQSSITDVTGKVVGILPYDVKVPVCAITTGVGDFGTYQNNTYWLAKNARHALRINPEGSITTVYGTPSSETVIEKTRSVSSYTLAPSRVIRNFNIVGDAIVYQNELIYRFNTRYSSSQLFLSGPGTENDYMRGINSISFSKDGEWMVGVSGYAIIRVKLSDLSYQTVSDGAGSFLAVSNDGRYIYREQTYSGSQSRVALYDLAGCLPSVRTDYYSVKNPMSGCVMYDWTDKVRAISGFSSFRYMSFSDDSTALEGYILLGTGTSDVRRATIASSAHNAELAANYVALGDSFSSGEGAYNYIEGSDEQNNRCHTSTKSYPYLLADSTLVGNFTSIACSGARTSNYGVYNSVPRVQYPSPNQSKPLNLRQPGVTLQSDHIDTNTQIITITMGGNDIEFKDKLVACITSVGTCYDTVAQRRQIAQEVDSHFDTWTTMYEDIRDKAPSAKIFVLGYPELFNTNGSCANNVHLNQTEILFGNALVRYLNETIKNATIKAGVNYVDVSQGLNGGRLCDAGNNLGVNGFTSGNDIGVTGCILVGPICNLILGNESYHPNERGHQLLANAVAQNSDNLSKPNPSRGEASTVSEDSILYTDLVGNQTDKTFYPILQPNPVGFITTIIKGEVFSYQIDGTDHAIKPFANADVLYFSEPVSVQTTAADEYGNIALSFVLDERLPTGYHTMQIQTTNVVGEKIAIYKVVYVAESADDVDGDGIANDVDACRAVANANVDRDQDDIDDACDGDIGPEPKDMTAPTMTLIGANDGSTLDLSTAQKPTCIAKDTGNNKPMSDSNPGIDLSCELNITGHAIYGSISQLSYSAEVSDEAGNTATLQGMLNVVNPRPVTPRVQSCSYNPTSATVTASFSYDNPNWLPVTVARSVGPDLSNVLEPSSIAQTQPSEFSVGSTDNAFTATAANHLTWRLTGLNTTTNGRTDCVIPPPAPTCQWPTRLTWYTLLQYLMCRLRTYTWR